MKSSYSSQWVAVLMAFSLLTSPAVAAPQSQQQTPQQPTASPQTSSPQSPTASGTSSGTSASSSSAQTTAQQPASDQDSTAPQQTTNPNVKAGSKNDVDAIGNRNVGKGLDFYSIEREIALGKQLAQQVDKSAKFIDDPVINEYVNRVGQNLVRNSDAKVPFTIKVIDSDEINAFALPGGFFYVNSGLVLRASEEAELAGLPAKAAVSGFPRTRPADTVAERSTTSEGP